jgi:hypothetical protein
VDWWLDWVNSKVYRVVWVCRSVGLKVFDVVLVNNGVFDGLGGEEEEWRFDVYVDEEVED